MGGGGSHCFNQDYVPVIKSLWNVGKDKNWVTQCRPTKIVSNWKRQLHAKSRWDSDPQFLKYYNDDTENLLKSSFKAKLISNDDFIIKPEHKSKPT